MWSAGLLLPHAPILVPEVASRSGVRPGKTLEAIVSMKTKLKGHTPEAILLLDPHAQTGLKPCVVNSYRFKGSLSGFGAGNQSVDATGVGKEASSLLEHINQMFSIAEQKPDVFTLDYASVVPLLFFEMIFGKIPPLLIFNPLLLDFSSAYKFGIHLRRYNSSTYWLLLASGDLSHRLKKDSPAGFHPDGEILDRKIQESIVSASPEPVFSLTVRTILNGGECGLRSVLALIGISLGEEIELLSYEAPFGVGYATALWKPERPAENVGKYHLILARKAIEMASLGKDPNDHLEEMPLFSDKSLEERKACFVSIKTVGGELRGCIGTVVPVFPSIGEEIVSNAYSAACKDPRFMPVAWNELLNCRISVDVLDEPEPITDLSLLDPKVFGVIVEKGSRRGVLLPDLDGVETVEKQLGIALSKAGIGSAEGVRISRFRVSRFSE